MRSLAFVIAMTLAACSGIGSAAAQQVGDGQGGQASSDVPSPVAVSDVEALIERMQKQVEAMSAATAERDEALRFLEEQIERATGRIEGTEATAEAARQRAAELDVRLEDLSQEREQLTSEVDERAGLIASLEARIAELGNLLSLEQASRTDVERQLEAEKIARKGTEQALAQSREQSENLLQEQQSALGVAEERVVVLEDQLERLTSQLLSVSGLLQQSDETVRRQQSRISDLGAKLNEALQARVEELSEYRSEFFGKLKASLGNRPEFRIVGDRFVFQSEVLFASGSAQIDPEGQIELQRLAEVLVEVAGTIPAELDWILRVDGHTDKVPVGASSNFSSNWDLSTARAISVVQFLIRAGIDPHRLAATGFGEFQPLDPGNDEISYRRNRRIEFKLTSG